MNLWSYIPVFTILVPFVVGLIRFKEINQFRYLFFFVSYGLFTEIVIKTLKGVGFGNSLFLGHFYALVSFVLLCQFYKVVFRGYIKRIWFNVLMFGFVVLCGVQLLFFQSLKNYPGLQLATLALVMIVLAIIYFQKVLNEANVVSLRREPLVWINAAILIYYSGNLFHYLLFNLLLVSSAAILDKINSYFFVSANAIFYLLIAIGFWKAGKQKAVNV